LKLGPDVLLALDEDGLEVLGVEAPEDVEHRALVVARAERLISRSEEMQIFRSSAGGPQRRSVVVSESKFVAVEQWKA